MAKSKRAYKSEKRSKELSRIKKREEKRLRRLGKVKPPEEGGVVDPSSGGEPAPEIPPAGSE